MKRVGIYQSHQSGIETVDGRGGIDRGDPTNRTNLELKRTITSHNHSGVYATNRTNLELKPGEVTAYSDARFYQSHQSGIETCKSVFVSGIVPATNRTNLELKR